MKCLCEAVEGPQDLLDLHNANPERYPCLLESVAEHPQRSRFDILFAFPDNMLVHGESGQSAADFLAEFNQWFQSAARPDIERPAQVPFYGGWFVYLGYELAGQIETGLNLPKFEGNFPVAWATRFRSAVVRDRISGECFLVAEPDAAAHVQSMQEDIDRLAAAATGKCRAPGMQEQVPEQFTAALEKIKDYIRDGDVFQVNLSRLWQGDANGTCNPADLYRQLRLTNPAPFAALVRYGDSAICSSSPERLVSSDGRRVQTRPIAGTHPRHNDEQADQALREQLVAHPKERAEHIMLIDLERNDLGRVCKPGSVRVDELMVTESYAHVHHIVSNVSGELADNVLPGDVLRAVFPGGTITGCPKVRCMEIIAELEQQGRGPYTGSLGYINHDGSMDFNILIRSMYLEAGHLEVRAGAGIVADSQPRKELEETRHKARGMLLALDA